MYLPTAQPAPAVSRVARSIEKSSHEPTPAVHLTDRAANQLDKLIDKVPRIHGVQGSLIWLYPMFSTSRLGAAARIDY